MHGWALLIVAFASDAALERAVRQAMSARTGAAVVLDVDSGHVVAAHGLEAARQQVVRPGSTVKPFTLLALLNAHRVQSGTALVCQRVVRLGARRLDCTHPVTPLPLDATAALAYSCNFFFATLAAKLPPDEPAATFARVGLSAAPGSVRPAAGEAQRQLQALGEANIEVTPLTVVEAYRRLALRRKSPKPLDAGVALIYAGLEAATEYGTARLAQPAGLRVAGKTGTSGGHAWFAGFAPAGRPRIAVVVFLEQGAGGADAAPVALEIFAALQTSSRRPPR